MATRRRGSLPYITRHGAGWRGWWMVAGARVRGPVRATDLEAYHDAIAHRQATPKSAVRMTLGGAIALVEAELVKLRRREGTLAWFADKKRTVLGSWAADAPLDALDAREVQAWFDTRLTGGWSPTTARHFSRFLSRVFRVAARHGWGGTSPLARVTLPAASDARPDVFGWQEALDLIHRLREFADVRVREVGSEGAPSVEQTFSTAQRDADLLELLLRTGLRRSELSRLRPEDVDLRAKSLHVRGKTGARILPLSEQAADCVQRLMHIVPAPAGEQVVVAQGEAQLHQLTPDQVSKVFAKWARRLREPRLHPHAFRHTFATELVRRGTPLPTVARLLGHRGLQMVMRYYSASEPSLREAVQGM